MWGLLSTILTILTALCFCVDNGESSLLANMYQDNMVLQMAPKRSQLWGFGDEPFAEISIQLKNETFYTTVARNRTWQVQLPPQAAGGPFNITITHSSVRYNGASYAEVLANVLFGDVWLCLGEANMVVMLNDIFNGTDEAERSARYSDRMRVAEVSLQESPSQMNTVDIVWSVVDPTIAIKQSATCLIYGMNMADEHPERPIGLILAAAWGQTAPIETWISSRVVSQCCTPATPLPGELGDINYNSAYWNGVVYPLTNAYSIRGIIMYQGESNVGYNPDRYQCHLREMITDYRNTFLDGAVGVPEENNIAFPFGVIQLGTMQSSDRKEEWGDIRMYQTNSMGFVPNSNYPEMFMAVTYDLSDDSSPLGRAISRQKKPVAVRLSNAASALLYNASYAPYGPYSSYATRGAAGIVGLTFDRNITVKGTQGFTYQLSSGEWYTAAKFLHISGPKVGVAVPDDAVVLAYAWCATVCDLANCALYAEDEDALPVQPWKWQIQSSGYSTATYFQPEVLNIVW